MYFTLFYVLSLESVKEYFNVVLAGLAGTSHMVSATIGSLARLIYEFNGKYIRCINFIDLFFTFLCLSPLFSSLFSSLSLRFIRLWVGGDTVEQCDWVSVSKVTWGGQINTYIYKGQRERESDSENITIFLFRLLLLFCLTVNWLHTFKNWSVYNTREMFAFLITTCLIFSIGGEGFVMEF